VSLDHQELTPKATSRFGTVMTLSDWIYLGRPAAALRRADRLSEKGKIAEAFAILSRAAKAGIPEAEHRVAQSYLEGRGVPYSRAAGAQWLLRAAKHGSVEAQLTLSTLCIHGLINMPTSEALEGKARTGGLFADHAGDEPDFETALTWSRQAAQAGSAQAEALVGYILTNGPESMRDLDEAHRCYERSAVSGCPEGCLGYAMSLARQSTDADNLARVAGLLRRAAEAGISTAIYLLAVLTEHGAGTTRDPIVAVQLFRHAAERGHRSAQFRWGLALIEGRYVEKDMETGEWWLRRAGLAGDPEAATLVGDLYARHGSLPPNYTEAAIWYRRAAEAGHQLAARALGTLYLTGAGMVQDKYEAARWLRASGEKGNRGAQVELANLLLEDGGPDDRATVAKWFEDAAQSGDLVAAFNVGVCLARGVGVERDEEQAAHWLRRAAEGVTDAQYIYARMLAEGRGLECNLPEARAWFARAAEAGMPDAEVALAEMMANGRGGPRDLDTALRLFAKAADEGHSGAMFALGALHGGNLDVPMDRVAAQRWFRYAAERGHGPAQLMLGRYLVAGAAGERNSIEGRDWLERAAAQGIVEAESDLAELSVTSGA
jgi:uncharacterized protein